MDWRRAGCRKLVQDSRIGSQGSPEPSYQDASPYPLLPLPSHPRHRTPPILVLSKLPCPLLLCSAGPFDCPYILPTVKSDSYSKGSRRLSPPSLCRRHRRFGWSLFCGLSCSCISLRKTPGLVGGRRPILKSRRGCLIHAPPHLTADSREAPSAPPDPSPHPARALAPARLIPIRFLR